MSGDEEEEERYDDRRGGGGGGTRNWLCCAYCIEEHDWHNEDDYSVPS